MLSHLPPVDYIDKLPSEVAYYGASYEIARETKLIDLPVKGVHWVHGWKYGEVLTAEQIGGYHKKKKLHLVSHPIHEEVLRSEGFKNVFTVGLPYLYAKYDSNLPRQKRSLLVCPGHTSSYSINKNLSQEAKDYANRIGAIRSDFSEVLVCLSANCIQAGHWLEAFEAKDIPWVMGAMIYDRNALRRMRSLFRQFEFVTTNCVGSHIVYASYEGCKTSICGWQDLHKLEDFSDEPFFKGKEDLLKESMGWGTEKWIRRHYEQLFYNHPKDATILPEWAATQLGEKYMKSPQYIAGLFFKYRTQNWSERVVSVVLNGFFQEKPICKSGSNSVWSNQKSNLKYRKLNKCNFSLSSISDKELKKTERLRKARWKRQKKQLLRAPRYSDGFVRLFGRPFRYLDTHSLTYTVDHIFNRGVYAFDSDSKTPLIIDAGANVGVSLLYFKRRFPRSRVICFEPDPKVFSALEMNVRTYEIENCELHRAALWSDNRVLEFCSEGADAGAISKVGGSGTPTLVRALDLLPFLQEQTVDFLKMDIEGAEVEVLKACQSGLKNVQRIFIEYHSFEGSNQRLAELFQILEGAGFRLHLNNAGLCSKQPMLGVDTYLGMDMQFDLFGYRI